MNCWVVTWIIQVEFMNATKMSSDYIICDEKLRSRQHETASNRPMDVNQLTATTRH